MFPTTRVDPGDQPLKSGFNSVKIGGRVLVGRLKGAPIFTLTLEERATCPTTCAFWSTCYGNNMQMAHRQRHGAALEIALERQLGLLNRKHPSGFLVRLHVLGDFYSAAYVDFWANALRRFPALHVFGFTARRFGTSKIGNKIAAFRERWPDRFMIRESGHPGKWGSVVYPGLLSGDIKTIEGAVVCPEQRDALAGHKKQMHCGSCAICWQTSRPIIFMAH